MRHLFAQDIYGKFHVWAGRWPEVVSECRTTCGIPFPNGRRAFLFDIKFDQICETCREVLIEERLLGINQ